jgi:NhaP-type Na+/H+ or K+/H+ antiporter
MQTNTSLALGIASTSHRTTALLSAPYIILLHQCSLQDPEGSSDTPFMRTCAEYHSPTARMVWSHLSVGTANLTCLFFGAFTSVFMLYSAFFKQSCYLGEANIAFITGIVFGPLAANIFNPVGWGNIDNVVLECTRVILVVQCFAVAVELRKQYIERHWKSLIWILGPVMVGGWMISALAVYFMTGKLSWKECLACAACFNAIDPILAATVVGKGRFAEKVPVHLQNLLLAESACNGITTTLALGLSTHLIRYAGSPKTIAFRFFVLTTAYEVLFGAVGGLIIGFTAQWALKKADGNDLIDRHSLLSFYFAIALLCTGVGSALGVDEVLLGFFAGYAFDRDDWFQEQTEDAGLSITIDLLLNLSYFVFLGAIIPWKSFDVPQLGITPWRLVVGTLMIFVLRRVPVVLAFARTIPEIKSFREALFYGHFGPIGPGAVFSAILVKATFDTGGSKQLGELSPDSPFYQLSSTIWPIVTFVVLCSSIVHGSSIPVWILGKQINTLPIILTYSQASSTGASWANRLPRLSIERSGDAIPAWAANIPPGTPPRRNSSDAGIRAPVMPVLRRSSTGTLEVPATAELRSRLMNRLLSCHASSTVVGRERKFHGTSGRAYQFGNTMMVEDDAGEVLKSYTIPCQSGDNTTVSSHLIEALGFTRQGERLQINEANDDGLRFSRRGSGRKMNPADLIRALQQLDPKHHSDPGRPGDRAMANAPHCAQVNIIPPTPAAVYTPDNFSPNTSQIVIAEDAPSFQPSIDTTSLKRESINSDSKFKANVKERLSATSSGGHAVQMCSTNGGSENSVPAHDLASNLSFHGMGNMPAQSRREGLFDLFATEVLGDDAEWVETAAEQRRRLAALSSSSAVFEDSGSNSDDDEGMPRRLRVQQVPVRVAAAPASSRARRVSWGDEVRHD